MMRTKPIFATVSDFYNKWGIDLSTLKSNGNISNKGDSFLIDVEDRIMEWIDANTFRVIRWEDLSDFQKEKMQRAVLLQAMYEYRNGNVGLDSGYDPERGQVASPEYLHEIEICKPAIDALITGGLYNHTITNRRRFFNISR